MKFINNINLTFILLFHDHVIWSSAHKRLRSTRCCMAIVRGATKTHLNRCIECVYEIRVTTLCNRGGLRFWACPNKNTTVMTIGHEDVIWTKSVGHLRAPNVSMQFIITKEHTYIDTMNKRAVYGLLLRI